MLGFDEFQFKGYEYAAGSATLALRYAYANGPDFEERIEFPKAAIALTADQASALDRAFRLIFLLSGVSYYKAYVAARIRCEPFELDRTTADFLTRTYINGLGEFAYKNGLNLDGQLRFEAGDSVPSPAPAVRLGHGALVPIGGGKDSIVTIESLRKAGAAISLFAVGSQAGIAEPILRTAAIAGLPLLAVKRVIAPNLLELNRRGALNGHVPITAIISSIAVACAILHGLDTVIMSNESSANSPNLRMGELEINHQYSKSLAFETDFAAVVGRNVASNFSYFSLLRGFSEIEIARRFAILDRYHHAFRSCNTAFRLSKEERKTVWCCDCPKCRFVFLSLAPFIGKAELVAIFGRNMLDDESQMAGFEELCGLRDHKPFECVGAIDESSVTLAKLFVTTAWSQDVVVRNLGSRILAREGDPENRFQQLISGRSTSRIPPEYRSAVDALQ